MRDKDLTLQTDEGGTFRSPSSVFCSVSEHLPPARRQLPANPHTSPGQPRPAPASSGQAAAPFPAELATLPHRPWAPKPSEPSISGFSSTKLPFLCAFVVRNPHFQAFRAQNRGFCALLAFGTPDFRLFEHKIAIFVLGKKGIGIGKNKYGLPANHRAHL